MSTASLQLPGSLASAPALVVCSHCGLAVPAGLVQLDQSLQFCCAGCQTVYHLIHQHGLQNYYRVRKSVLAAPKASAASARQYMECDDPAFHALYVREAGPHHQAVEFFLPAVHCAACVWLVERLPRILPGVIQARLDLRKGLAAITWRSDLVPLSSIALALDRLGYPPLPARSAQARAAQRAQDRRQLIRLAVAGACAGNVMLLAVALYAGAFSGMDHHIHAYLQFFSMGLGLLSLAWPGSGFFISAWKSLRARVLHLDVPIALGLAAGGLWSFLSTLAGSSAVYFDSLSVLVFALLAGRWFQQRQQRWAADALELLFGLTPSSARKVSRSDTDGEIISDVAIQSVALGDCVEVRPGESFPVDGLVTAGSSAADESLLSGESRPVPISIGSRVAAGTLNLHSVVRASVQACGDNTRVARLMKLVEDAARRKAPIVKLADRLAGWFTFAMLVLAALTFALWSSVGFSLAISHAVALLIVTCPCALGLATPLAMTVAVGRAARTGLLIKGADTIQSLASPATILLDKTGTLTEGRMRLAWFDGPADLIPSIIAVESCSAHHVARALVADLSRLPGSLAPLPAFDSASVHQVHGRGISASLENARFDIGSLVFMNTLGISVPLPLQLSVDRALSQGLSPVIIARNASACAVAAVGDPLRHDARSAIDQLRALGFNVAILSGDHPQIVQQVGHALDIPAHSCHGGCSPEQKLAMVRDLLARGPIIMVGDGANDAAALAAASVGIAVKGGTEASLAAADVYLGSAGLHGIIDLILGSRRAMRVIRRNLLVSLAYNLLAASLAVAGLINPLLAAILMPISSLTVVTISFRSRTFSPASPTSSLASIVPSDSPSQNIPPVLACP